MRRALVPLSCAALLVPLAAPCAVAGDLSVKKSVSLAGSPQETWSKIGDFCALPNWHPAVAACDIVSGTNNKTGAVRVLTLKDGAKIREELLSYDAKTRSQSYKILESPLPITSYVAVLSVSAGPKGGSLVEWKSTFKAAPGTEDTAAVKTVEGIYDAGLGNLQAREPAKPPY